MAQAMTTEQKLALAELLTVTITTKMQQEQALLAARAVEVSWGHIATVLGCSRETARNRLAVAQRSEADRQGVSETDTEGGASSD